MMHESRLRAGDTCVSVGLGSTLVMSNREGRLGSAIVVALAFVTSGPADAQPTGAQAEAVFRQGKELMATGRIAEACAAFDASQKLDPTVPTLLNQANCRERNGQLATAWGLFLEAERQTRAGTNKASQQMHATALARAAKLEPRMSTLRIDVPAGSRVSGLEILRNGEVLDLATWSQALPIDGGTYHILARAPGNAEWSSTIEVAAEGDARTIEIPELRATKVNPAKAAEGSTAAHAPAKAAEGSTAAHAPARAAEGSTAARAPALSEIPMPSGSSSVWSTKRKLAMGAAVGGVLALAAGGVFGVSATRNQHDAHALCSDPQLACDGADRANELIRSGHNRAIDANVAFGVGAAAVTVAGVLWLIGAPESHRRLPVMPAALPGQVIVTTSGSF
jgi:hypothetical protein